VTYILCIETTTDICSVCLAGDSKVIAIRETARSFSHSEVIAVFIDECLKEANITPNELSAVAVSGGPGSYTALRGGTSTAKGLCYGLKIPLIAVDTLKALAVGIQPKAAKGDLIIPMLDARRKEVYQAIYTYDLTNISEVSPLILDENSFLQHSTRRIHICGDGAAKAQDILSLPNAVFHTLLSSAEFMIGEAFDKFESNTLEDTAYYEPYYFKGPNITVQKKNILR